MKSVGDGGRDVGEGSQGDWVGVGVVEEPRTDSNSICRRGRGDVGAAGRSGGGIWCTLALALAGNNRSNVERDEPGRGWMDGGMEGAEGGRGSEKVLPKRRARNSLCCSRNAAE